jgi:hypothetical protein
MKDQFRLTTIDGLGGCWQTVFILDYPARCSIPPFAFGVEVLTFDSYQADSCFMMITSHSIRSVCGGLK